MNKGPDFLCIGAQKAGTTWLYENIMYHPEVWLPPSPFKELHYFDNKVPHKDLLEFASFTHGGVLRRYSALYKNPSWEVFRWLWRYNHHANDSMHWYRSLFTKQDRKCGDITPEYSTLDERGVEYVRKVVGDDCKVFIILRDPVSRSWSSLKMLYRFKKLNISDVDVSLLINEVQKPYLVHRSDYSRMIETWKKYFDEKTFAVFFYDDLVKAPDKLLEDICQFIGVTEAGWSSPLLEKKYNSDRKKVIMPEQVRIELSRYFLPELEKLSEMVGSHSINWLQNAEKVVSNQGAVS